MRAAIARALCAILALGCTGLPAAPRTSQQAAPRTSQQATPGPSAPESPLSIQLHDPPWRGDLDGMVRRRVVRVLVPWSRTLYFVDLGGTQRGISYDFMRAFEDDLNRRLGRDELKVHCVFIPVARDRLLPALLEGRGDVAAANLTITPERRKQVDFTVPLAHDVNEIIVTGPGAPRLATLDDLAGREIYVSRSSSYWETLQGFNRSLRARHLAPVRLREAPGHFSTEDILEMANAGLVPIVVADRYLALLWRGIYRDIAVREDLVLASGADVGFAFRRGSPQLAAALNAFAATHAQGTTFGNITLRKYLQDTRWVRNATSEAELRKFASLVQLFRKYGTQYRVDWLLMAAQGYQESRLDNARRSAVGAVGVMQLMPATGREMAVGDVTQLEPNIHAGVKYMRRTVDLYFRDPAIGPVDRMLFAFAAYNAGPARVRALRHEARALGLDPNLWFDNVERVAAARIGRETVQYVSNIYKYYIAYTLVQEKVAAGLERRSNITGD
jgi:membrane-bound lytic murein transglycosylase MltF